MANLLRRSSHQATFTKEDILRHREAWRQPGAIRAMVNWYRAVFRRSFSPIPSSLVETPSQIIWGEQDVALRFEMAEESLNFCRNAQLHRLPEATHWVQHDEAHKVNQLLLDFLELNK